MFAYKDSPFIILLFAGSWVLFLAYRKLFDKRGWWFLVLKCFFLLHLNFHSFFLFFFSFSYSVIRNGSSPFSMIFSICVTEFFPCIQCYMCYTSTHLHTCDEMNICVVCPYNLDTVSPTYNVSTNKWENSTQGYLNTIKKIISHPKKKKCFVDGTISNHSIHPI